MPFKSQRQEIFLKINHPAIYKRWKAEYGTKIRKTARVKALKGVKVG